MSETYPFFFTWTAQENAKPKHITGGKGVYFDTADGQKWLDMGALVYQANLGHGDQRVIDAVKKQADELCLTMPTAVYPAKEKLAEKLLEIAGPNYSKVFFTLGGSEAVENAIKMARMFTGRKKLVSRYRSYHGATLGALSLTGDWRRPPLEPGIWGAVKAMDCYCQRCPFGKTVDTCKRECATQIGDLLKLEGEGTVAAVVLESVPGANGVLVPPDDYWPKVREACTEDGALLVADEVLCGFGRCGKWFGFQNFDVEPDLITIGKGLTGGYGVLGGVIVHKRIAEFFEKNFLFAGLTNYAHPLGCASGLAALEVYEEDNMIENGAALAPILLDGLAEFVTQFEEVKFSRGLGMLAAIELEASDEQWSKLSQGMNDENVFVHLRQRNGCIMISPPLCITEAELKDGLARIGRALAKGLTAS